MKAPARRLRPLELPDVRIDDRFWSPRLEVSRRVGIPHQYRMCQQTGRIDALRLQWRPGQPNRPHKFWDSDVAKWIEAAAYALATGPDETLRRQVEEVVDLFAASQQPDGYLNTHFTTVAPQRRWTNLRDDHELYCAGHLIEAAVAYFHATGRDKLLGVARRLADHIDAVFGPRPGQKRGYPGHEEIELALVRLHRATGEGRYLALAKFFVDERGQRPNYFELEAAERGEDPLETTRWRLAYWQAHAPVREQPAAVGHAVRSGYLYCAMADVAAETADAGLFRACRRLWDSIVRRRMYVTGGIGARHEGESHGADYELPNQRAYAETCAAIALVFFAHRMLQIDPAGEYADAMERALYNGVLSGSSLDGTRFFYVNPMASAGDHHRQEWFGCACCPPNYARLLASLGQYAYSAGDGAAWVHLYIAGAARCEVAGTTVQLDVQTDYPWNGDIVIRVRPERPASFALRLRVPGWCRRHRIELNGRPLAPPVARGYARIRRRWTDGDVVRLRLAMPPTRLAADPRVLDDVRRVALARGPVVHCLEQCDHDVDVHSIVLPDRARLAVRRDDSLAGGAVVLEADALAAPADPAAWAGQLYRPAFRTRTRRTRLRAVPYFLWDNRRPGGMTVWIGRS